MRFGSCSRSIEGLQAVDNIGRTIGVLLNPVRCSGPRSFQVGWIMCQPPQERIRACDRGCQWLLDFVRQCGGQLPPSC